MYKQEVLKIRSLNNFHKLSFGEGLYDLKKLIFPYSHNWTNDKTDNNANHT